ncbi:MAG: 50S ribosomal protein L3 [Bacteroidia bacterium]|nr:50S ribosomal protein L3 [Bacteroidia bacterium]MCX7652715.1 50S ribosomal protein L3 [Bacteroidia bacterium]MDW8416401.1 50S ribosomal protein L3 [Bacteroidia bacterium]
MLGLIGRKVGMTSFFTPEGDIACTIIEAGPCPIVNIRTQERDGYIALQLGYGSVKPKHLRKPLSGYFKKQGVEPVRLLKEFRLSEPGDFQIGQVLDVRLFGEGDVVSIAGWTKGRGFAGVVKRHGFAGVGGRTHGQHNRERHPGSMGSNTFPGRVWKGKRLAGRYGNERVTVENLSVLKVIPEKNILVVSGAVPGPRGGLLLIYK